MPLTDEGAPTSLRADRLIQEATGQAHRYCARYNISGEAALQHLIGRLQSTIRVLCDELEGQSTGVTP